MNGYRFENNMNNALSGISGQVGSAFGLNKQVDQRPWLVIGAALAVGYVLGSLGGQEKQEKQDDRRWETRDYESRYNDLSSSKNYSQPSYYGGGTPSNAPAATQTNYTSSVYNTYRPDTSVGAGAQISAGNASSQGPAQSIPAAPQQPQSSLPEGLNTQIDTAISTAGTSLRNLLRDVLRDNVPAVRDQVDALDRRDGRIT
ncbi:MAG: hypothetical protein H7Z42_09375 [Roseiflexaceae bacterium]|nr:hypothetical protein [Roseiflexaceae bacterium]